MNNFKIKDYLNYILGVVCIFLLVIVLFPNNENNTEEFEDYSYQVEELESEINYLEEEIDRYQNQIEDLEKQIENLEEERDSYDDELTDCLCKYESCPTYPSLTE